MIISFEDVYFETNIDLKSKSLQLPVNRIRPRAVGIIIEDSVNNIFFPIPNPVLDTNKQNLPIIQKQYDTLYGGETNSILPWHFVIEYLDRDYIIYNTRPINIMYPYEITNELKNTQMVSEETSQVLQMNPQIQNMIHILLIGDSTKDVYTKQLYKKIIEFIINPISKTSQFNPIWMNTVLPLNLGNRFISKLFQGMLLK